MSTRRAAIAWGAALLAEAGVDSPRLDARLLLAHALGLAPSALLADLDAPAAAPGYGGLIARRAAREPLALILGHREFWSLDLLVSPASLIPRPESETLIEAALAAFAGAAPPARILDLGTGTGALLLAALVEFPAAFGIGLDRAPEAAALARRNAARLGLGLRAAFLAGEWGEALAGGFDLVLANPPYIPRAEIAALMPEVARFEPAGALDGGPDGLDAYRAILGGLGALLTARGVAVLELGQGQEAAVAMLAAARGFAGTARRDLAGIPRALVLRARLP
ncbi:MAG: peptide chain release factor N(5)-glutamine methyltransferase [Rhodospirillales bacterium]|nr:peptide chain release factor N(5)-glutamine methyltransferase [Rhodospirillales bacterium]